MAFYIQKTQSCTNLHFAYKFYRVYIYSIGLKNTSKTNALKMLHHCLPLEGGAVCYFERGRTAFSISLSSSQQILGHWV